jgi:hypothetical protein
VCFVYFLETSTHSFPLRFANSVRFHRYLTHPTSMSSSLAKSLFKRKAAIGDGGRRSCKAVKRVGDVDASNNRPGDVCEIEEIRHCKYDPVTGKPAFYLIKWTNSDDEDSTYEPVENLVDSAEAIAEFHACKEQWRFQYWAYHAQNGKPAGWLDMNPVQWGALSSAYAAWGANGGTMPGAPFADPEDALGPRFFAGRYWYRLDFGSMMQSNLDPRYKTRKFVRALPIPPSPASSAAAPSDAAAAASSGAAPSAAAAAAF